MLKKLEENVTYSFDKLDIVFYSLSEFSFFRQLGQFARTVEEWSDSHYKGMGWSISSRRCAVGCFLTGLIIAVGIAYSFGGATIIGGVAAMNFIANRLHDMSKGEPWDRDILFGQVLPKWLFFRNLAGKLEVDLVWLGDRAMISTNIGANLLSLRFLISDVKVRHASLYCKSRAEEYETKYNDATFRGRIAAVIQQIAYHNPTNPFIKIYSREDYEASIVNLINCQQPDKSVMYSFEKAQQEFCLPSYEEAVPRAFRDYFAVNLHSSSISYIEME